MIANCPHCSFRSAKVVAVVGDRRRLLCSGCGRRFTMLASGESVPDLRTADDGAPALYRKRLQVQRLTRRLAVVDDQLRALESKRYALLVQLSALA